MAIFFTSDQHYGHANIIKHCGRPFSSLHEMNVEMIRRHNETVSNNDIVYHLGDIVWGHQSVEKVFSLLNGKHYLVPGNHDAVHKLHQKHGKQRRTYYERAGIEILDIDVTWDVQDIGKVRLCHFPYTGDHTLVNDRYKEWRPVRNDERILLHGHVHERWKVRGNEINVGVDQWDFAPVSYDTLIDLMKSMLSS